MTFLFIIITTMMTIMLIVVITINETKVAVREPYPMSRVTGLLTVPIAEFGEANYDVIYYSTIL